MQIAQVARVTAPVSAKAQAKASMRCVENRQPNLLLAPTPRRYPLIPHLVFSFCPT